MAIIEAYSRGSGILYSLLVKNMAMSHERSALGGLAFYEHQDID